MEQEIIRDEKGRFIKRKFLNEKEIVRLYTKEHKTCKQISELFNCSYPPIYNILKENNINTSSKGKTYEEKFGKEIAEERKKKLIGHKVSEETRKKIREKAIKPERIAISIKNLPKGQEGYWLGKRRPDMSGENHPLYGTHRSEESRKKSKDSRFKYLKEHPESIEKIKEARAKQVTPFKDTSIEVKIQNFLTLLKVEYIAHKYISEIENRYCCDIFIPLQRGIKQKIIIECDGDYFHANPDFYSNEKLNKRQIEQRERDELRNKQLTEKGYKVIRLWEHDIKRMELNNFESIIK
ncbi:MAG: NUMOD3 domain-containing DNA-binding protein [Candidatus Woesearchaeota archaeon]|jgi:hypothetical protein